MTTTQAQAVAQIATFAERKIHAAMLRIDPKDAAAVADLIHTVVPAIAERYGLSAGVLAAEWYDQMRQAAEVRGYFRAEPASLPTQGRYAALANWVAGKDEVEILISGAVQRIIANAHRETIMRASVADPQAEGWARFGGGGDGSCGFCYMLISRGAVYSESSVAFGAHDHCNCTAGPVFAGQRRMVDAHAKSARRREDVHGNAIGATKADQERARDWIDRNL